MTPFKDLSIKRKITGLCLLASGSALALASAAFLGYDVITFRKSMVHSLSTQAEIVGFNSASSLLFQDVSSAERTLAALKAERGVRMAGIYDGVGRSFAVWRRHPDDRRPLPPAPEGREEVHAFEGDALSLVRPIVFDGAPVGSVYILSDLRGLRQRVYRYAGISLTVFLLALGWAAFVSFRFGHGISQPILDLVQAAKAVSTGKDYSVRAPGGGRDEVGLLVGTFNEMLSQIQAQGDALQKSHGELELRVKERTAELEAANKELEAFSYSVSHDLRAPLRSIDGFSQALLEDCGEQLNDAGRDSLRRVRSATQRMGELIDGMLSLSRLGRQGMSREAVDLGELARSVLEELRRGDPSRQVELVVGQGMEAHGDRKLLRAVLENLLGNAWKFTLKKPSARIEVGAFLQDGGARTFFIKDNGAGFSMTYVHKLFGVFQRLHAPEDFAGTGIGLATVQRIIIRHGGRIWAEGRVGEGATFYFTLS